MITISDTVTVKAGREHVARWLCNMEANYLKWHPQAHHSFRVLPPDTDLREGAIARAEETLGRRKLRFKFEITRVEDDRYLAWRATYPYRWGNLKGAFKLESVDSHTTDLTAITSYGWKIPGIAPALDWLIDRLFLSRAVVAAHMREEGERLKNAVEANEARDEITGGA